MLVPAALALLIAGGASARGSLALPLVAGSALLALVLGDALMFLLGRYTGWRLLTLLCRVSLNPESCILRSADSFYRRGRTVLVIAKFIPGINTMAPALAGSMNMRFPQFLRLDLCGTALYICAYFTAGYVGSDVLGALTSGYRTMGGVVTSILIVGTIFYVAFQVRAWMKSRALRTVPSVLPAEALREIDAGNAIVFD